MTITRLRWRLANLIAPVPILAAPPTPGPAILMRAKESPDVLAWLTPTTLDIEMSNALGSFPEDPESWEYKASVTRGTITGTI